MLCGLGNYGSLKNDDEAKEEGTTGARTMRTTRMKRTRGRGDEYDELREYESAQSAGKQVRTLEKLGRTLCHLLQSLGEDILQTSLDKSGSKLSALHDISTLPSDFNSHAKSYLFTYVHAESHRAPHCARGRAILKASARVSARVALNESNECGNYFLFPKKLAKLILVPIVFFAAGACPFGERRNKNSPHFFAHLLQPKRDEKQSSR